MASRHEGGNSPLCRIVLKAGNKIGISCCLNALYHSNEKTSGPGDLFVLSLDIALFNSSSVISADNLAFQVSLTEGSFKGVRKE